MTARGDQLRAGPGPVPPVAVELAAEPDEAWLARYHYRGQEGLPPIALRVLTSAPWQAFASVRAAGQAIAIGRVAVADGWAGLTAIEVDPAHRRRGLARVVTRPSPPRPPPTAPGICTSRSRTTTRPPTRCTGASASPTIMATTTASPPETPVV